MSFTRRLSTDPTLPMTYLEAVERGVACGALTPTDRQHLIRLALVALLDARVEAAMQIERLLVARAIGEREVGG